MNEQGELGAFVTACAVVFGATEAVLAFFLIGSYMKDR